MRRIVPTQVVPSLIWFTALAGPGWGARAMEANIPTNACASLPADSAGGSRQAVVYRNREYGFTFTLPSSWKGFTVLACRWDGQRGEHREEEDGPLLVIRHPLYTEQNPREDIPIMVFTQAQWRAVNDSDLDSALIVSAAPIPPSELGRNRKYIFALPPRFSFDELEGVEEVLKIVNGKPLHPARIASRSHEQMAPTK